MTTTELKDGQQVRIGDKYYTIHLNNKRPSLRLWGYSTKGLIEAIKKGAKDD